MDQAASLDTSTDVLAFVREQQQASEAAQLEMLRGAVQFCAFHSPDSLPVGEYGGVLAFGEGAVTIAGEGAPGIAEFAPMEFAANLGWSTETGLAYLAEAMELRYRLTRTWTRVASGEVPVWRARRIAGHTMGLSAEAAGFVDQHVAGFAEKIGPAQLDRLCDEARDRFDPDDAEARRLEQAEQRKVSIRMPDHTLHQGHDGLAYLEATLDVADARDLENAVAQVATGLLDLGSLESLDVRRSQALGEIARGQLALDLDAEPATKGRKPRQTILTVHLSDATLGTGIVECEELKTHLSVEQVLGWLRDHIGDTEVIVKPVVDLNAEIVCGGYQPSERLRQQIVLAERTCAHPHCHRPAARCDLDHIEPHATGGKTTTSNLAPLCRKHHRAKTLGGWAYTKLRPRHYLWRSPAGLLYEKTPAGTRALHL